MLAIFDQIATGPNQLDSGDGILEVPADFPGMIDSFQQPVAYQQTGILYQILLYPRSPSRRYNL